MGTCQNHLHISLPFWYVTWLAWDRLNSRQCCLWDRLPWTCWPRLSPPYSFAPGRKQWCHLLTQSTKISMSEAFSYLDVRGHIHKLVWGRWERTVCGAERDQNVACVVPSATRTYRAWCRARRDGWCRTRRPTQRRDTWTAAPAQRFLPRLSTSRKHNVFNMGKLWQRTKIHSQGCLIVTHAQSRSLWIV